MRAATNQDPFKWMGIFCILFFALFWTANAEFYSDGYRMGQLTKFSIKGHFTKSGEGQLSMGREGSYYEKCTGSGKDRTCKRINPWGFSTTSKRASEVNALSGRYVVIKYGEVTVNNPLKYSTKYRVKNISGVDKTISLGSGLVKKESKGTKSKGFRIGRIVKVSRKGHFNKTYEMILQVGNSGNQYKHMSIQAKDMYEYAINVLKSAKKVKVLYTERGMLQLSVNDSKYLVYGIEIPEDI